MDRCRCGYLEPLCSRKFRLGKPIKHATAYICGLGYTTLRERPQDDDRVRDPASTYYHNDQPHELGSRVLYTTFDVADRLAVGTNAVGVMLGNGWYSAEADVPPSPDHRDPYNDRPILRIQLNIELVDGSRVTVVTDENWKTASGPIVYNDNSHGETYDACLERPGWDMPDYDDSDWRSAVKVAAPSGKLVSQMIPPIRVMDTLTAKDMRETAPGTYIVDFGQSIAGWTRLHVAGPRGAAVTLRHAQRLRDDMTLDDRSNTMPTYGRHLARQADKYILKGEGPESWEPRFTVHGFRCVEVTGFPGKPELRNFEARAVHNALEETGQFACSRRLLNQIAGNARWTFANSFQGIPQDAADRAERTAWLGDPGFIAEDYIYFFGGPQFWTKWLDDIHDSQLPDGTIPAVSPLHWRNFYNACPCWQSTYPLFAWNLYQYYDDTRVLEMHYVGIKKLVDSLGSVADNHIISAGLGDHMEPQADGTSAACQRTRLPA